jgi:hypothetical protein
MIEVHREVDQNPISNIFECSIISEDFKSSQISNQQWYSFFKTMDKINDSNFNRIAWFKGESERKFEYDVHQIDQEKYDRRMEMHNYLDDKPLMISTRYACNLLENLKRIKSPKIYLEYFDGASYIIDASVRVTRKRRTVILEYA